MKNACMHSVSEVFSVTGLNLSLSNQVSVKYWWHYITEEMKEIWNIVFWAAQALTVFCPHLSHSLPSLHNSRVRSGGCFLKVEKKPFFFLPKEYDLSRQRKCMLHSALCFNQRRDKRQSNPLSMAKYTSTSQILGMASEMMQMFYLSISKRLLHSAKCRFLDL